MVREQITRALQYQLTQLDQLRTKLGHLAYQDITNLWQAERVAKEHDELLATPIQYVNAFSHVVFSDHKLELALFLNGNRYRCIGTVFVSFLDSGFVFPHFAETRSRS